MKKLQAIILSLILLQVSNLSFADEVEIKMKKYPVSKTFSLGKRGVLFFGGDPNKNSNQKEIVLVKDSKIVWYSQFMPSAYDVIPIYSNESNYMYFVEEGYVKGGNLGYIFIDNSGTSRKGKLNLSLEMRKAGVGDMSKLDLIKMYSTKKYFVILFSEKSGPETSYYMLAVAHATQRTYPSKLVQTSYDAKEKYKSSFECIGTSGEKIMLAQRAVEGDFSGFYITFIDPKANSEDTRKFAFPIHKMALHQRIFTKGVYDNEAKEISASVTVKTKDYQGFISFQDNAITMAGLEFSDQPDALMIKKMDVNGVEKFKHRHLLHEEKYEFAKFMGKVKNGNFGFQLAFYKGYYIGAASGKSTFLMYLNGETGVVNLAEHEKFNLDEFNSKLYYIFENLREKEFAWYQICGGDFYTSDQPILNKKEFKIVRNKL
jgi:hypothetical protein